MSSEATQLKLRALELKKAGDLDGAKKLLARARAIEFENITVEELNDSGELKRLAVVLKRKGDIAGHKKHRTSTEIQQPSSYKIHINWAFFFGTSTKD